MRERVKYLEDRAEALVEPKIKVFPTETIEVLNYDHAIAMGIQTDHQSQYKNQS